MKPNSHQEHKEAKLRRLELISFAVISLILAFSLWLLWLRLFHPHEGPETALLGDSKIMKPGFRTRCGRPTKGNEAINVRLVVSDDKEPWLAQAATEYMDSCPNTKISLVPLDDMRAANAIGTNEIQATAWLPTNDLAPQYLENQWPDERGIPLLVEYDQSLLESPTVLFAWEDRYRAMEALIPDWGFNGEIWARSLCAALPFSPDAQKLQREQRIPGTWLDWKQTQYPQGAPPGVELPSDEELAAWGTVSFSHTSPTRSSLGLATLVLMSYDFVSFWSNTGMLSEKSYHDGFHESKDKFLAWLRRCEGGLDTPMDSTEKLTGTMFHVGMSFDGVVTTENLVFKTLDRIYRHPNTMRRIRVVYPQPTIVNNHPIVYLFPADPATKESREATKRYVRFLRSKLQQTKAIEFGFRPTNPTVSIRNYDRRKNPFLRLRSFGVKVDIDPKQPPLVNGAALRTLVEIWEDATGRN